MKHLIFDKLRRQWFLWLACCIFYSGTGSMIPGIYESIPFLPLYWLMMLNIGSYTSELDRGYGRVALTLPFTIRQIGHVLWFLSVILPMFIFAIFGGLGMLIAAPSLVSQSSLIELWIKSVVLSGLLFGSYFWLFSEGRQHRSLVLRICGFVIYLVLVGGGYLLLYKSGISGEIKFFIVCLAGLVFTIMGWVRCEGMVVDYGEHRSGAAYSIKPKGIFQPPAGFGGIRFLFATSGIRLAFGAIFITIIPILPLLINSKEYRSDYSHLISLCPMLFLIFIKGEAMSFTSHLNYMRTLPLTAKQLAGIILAMALLPYLVFSGLIAGIVCLNQGVLAGYSLFKGYVLGLAPVCMLITADVWQDDRRFRRIALIATLLIITMIAPIYQFTPGFWSFGGKDLPAYFIIGYPLVSCTMALFVISHLLQANDMMYRTRPQDVRGFGQANWS